MFDFPDTPKIVYKRNFLRSSIFNIEFTERISWEKHADTIQSLFKSEFPIRNNRITIDINFNQNAKDKLNLHQGSNAFELKSVDNLTVLAFENNILAIIFHGKSYESFQNFKKIFTLVNDRLLNRVLSQYSISKFSERKINLIDFQISNNNGLSLLKQLINTQLIGNIDYTPNSNFIKQSISSIVFEDEKANLNIKYGYNKINEGIGQIILDMVLFLNIDKPCSHIENFEKINTALYRAFHWAITEEYKELMQSI